MKRNKVQILREQYNEYCENSIDGQGDGMSFREYVGREADNDPGFFRWLFDDDELEDFDDGLTQEQKKEFNEWLSTL